MLADVAEVEGLEVAEMHGVEQHQYRHHLAVGKTARTVATPRACEAVCPKNESIANIARLNREMIKAKMAD